VGEASHQIGTVVRGLGGKLQGIIVGRGEFKEQRDRDKIRRTAGPNENAGLAALQAFVLENWAFC